MNAIGMLKMQVASDALFVKLMEPALLENFSHVNLNVHHLESNTDEKMRLMLGSDTIEQVKKDNIFSIFEGDEYHITVVDIQPVIPDGTPNDITKAEDFPARRPVPWVPTVPWVSTVPWVLPENLLRVLQGKPPKPQKIMSKGELREEMSKIFKRTSHE